MICRYWLVVIVAGVVVLTATPALPRGGFMFSFGVGVLPGVHHFHHPRFFHHPFGRPHGVFLDLPVHRPRVIVLQPRPPMGWWRR